MYVCMYIGNGQDRDSTLLIRWYMETVQFLLTVSVHTYYMNVYI